jgi:hypothetical protein
MALLSRLDVGTPRWESSTYMAVLGMGLGLALPVLTLVVQNSAPPADMGTATSANTYLRQIGGSVGAAVFGALLASRLTDRLAVELPRGVGVGELPDPSAVTPEVLATLPSAVRDGFVRAYAEAMPQIFLYLAPVLVLGLLFAFLLKEQPLTDMSAPGTEKGDEGMPQANPLMPRQPSGTTEVRIGRRGGGGADADGGGPARGAWPTGPYGSAGSSDPSTPSAAQALAVRGTVHEPGGAPLGRAVLTLIGAGGRQTGRTATRADGHYELPVPGPGGYVLIAAASGHQPRATSVSVGDRPVELDVLLGGTSLLSGAVNRGDGSAVPGATVVLTDVRGEVIASARTGDDGEYAFARLLPGSYTLAVNAEGFQPAALPVEAAGGGPVRQDVELDGGAGLRGIVRTRGGRPVEDARVTLVDGRGEVVASMTTAADGRFAFDNLPCGDYTLIAAGYPPVATALDISSGQVEQELTLGHPEG